MTPGAEAFIRIKCCTTAGEPCTLSSYLDIVGFPIPHEWEGEGWEAVVAFILLSHYHALSIFCFFLFNSEIKDRLGSETGVSDR